MILYINTHLSHICFALEKNIFNYKDICYFSFFNNGNIFFMITLYSGDHQSALKYLKDTEVDIWNILIMAGNFNIRNSNWDLSYTFHLIHTGSLLEIVDSFNLNLSHSIQQVPTCYSNNVNDANSVINFFFLWPNSTKIDNHSILSDLWYSLDHAPFVIDISITEEFIQDKRHIIIKNSEEEKKFTFKLIKSIRSINMSMIHNKNSLEVIIQEYTRILKLTWYNHS